MRRALGDAGGVHPGRQVVPALDPTGWVSGHEWSPAENVSDAKGRGWARDAGYRVLAAVLRELRGWGSTSVPARTDERISRRFDPATD
jgi:hypothetical protein